ncbi:uncharacterized protein LOC116849444 [Odontomachus brunneus]|uniref:uncharacterized protein LOC116849444 n=1 Tax=Odontomachus brunneus TaxID=486640 RepID=UPI0013F1F777|nr:uncharacterized protein LOC116849444 [Odontomachus brunneus]
MKLMIIIFHSPGNSNKHVIFSPIRTAVEDVDNDVEIIQNEQVNKEVEVIDISGDIDDPPIIWERFPDYVIDINDPAINWEHYPIAEIPLQKRVTPPFMIHPPEYFRALETFRKLCEKKFF